MAVDQEFLDQYDVKTKLSNTTFLEGVLNFKDSLRLDGQFLGDINSSGLLILGFDSMFKGNISSDTVIVCGEVRGNIKALNRVELYKTARVYGDIHTKKLKIEDGAIFEGQCEILSED